MLYFGLLFHFLNPAELYSVLFQKPRKILIKEIFYSSVSVQLVSRFYFQSLKWKLLFYFSALKKQINRRHNEDDPADPVDTDEQRNRIPGISIKIL